MRKARRGGVAVLRMTAMGEGIAIERGHGHRRGRFPTSEQVEWMFEGINGDVEVARTSIKRQDLPKRPSRRGPVTSLPAGAAASYKEEVGIGVLGKVVAAVRPGKWPRCGR